MKTSYATIDNINHTQRRRSLHKARRRRSHLMVGWGDNNPDFKCKNCGMHISAEPLISGVGHRNHCPYCLWSRHLDLFRAGDRLCACKGLMEPTGLTVKQMHKRYRTKQGELMLIHQCIDCKTLSINRIAADDLPTELQRVYQCSLEHDASFIRHLEDKNINILGAENETMVRLRLFGNTE
jgi:hypothetical protein